MVGKRPKDTNKIKSLNQLSVGDARVNVIAVTHTCSIVTATKGPQQCFKVEIIDDSTTNIVTCLMFASNIEMLPDISQITQPSILRLRRFNVESFGNKLQLQISTGFSWSFYSKDSTSFIPQHKSHGNTGAKLTEEEELRILTLREWISTEAFTCISFQKQVLGSGSRTGNTYCDGDMSFSHIQLNLYFNATAKVIATKEEANRIILRCIDGTKPPIETFKMNSLYMKTEISQVEMAQLAEYYLDISVYETHILTAMAIKNGDFVKFSNLHCYIPYAYSNDKPEVILHKGFAFNRGLRILSSGVPASLTQRVNDMTVKRSPEIIRVDPELYRPASNPPTQCEYLDLPITNISDIMKGRKFKYLYRIRLFIDAYSPDNYPSFLMAKCTSCKALFPAPPPCQCPSCSSIDLRYELFFSLLGRDEENRCTHELLCVGPNARKLLSIDENSKPSVGEIEEVEKLLGKWCEFHVVLSGEMKLVVMHTTIQLPNLQF